MGPALAGGSPLIILLIVAFGLWVLKHADPDRYKRITKRCRKKVIELRGDTGRGPVADQLRSILAIYGGKHDVYASWDKDGGGSVSRKEFRLWWPTIGYDAPVEDIDGLFDEFDADGSGEIDQDEFNEAFTAKGGLWLELLNLQKQNDESEAIHKAIVELESKITKAMKQRASEVATAKRLEEKHAIKKPLVSKTQDGLNALTTELAEKQARLDALSGGIKTVMKKAAIINAFKSFATPDEAAVAIQSRVRGRKAQGAVQEKLKAQKKREALIARTAAYVQDKELNRRLFELKNQLRVLVGVGGQPPPVLPFTSPAPTER